MCIQNSTYKERKLIGDVQKERGILIVQVSMDIYLDHRLIFFFKFICLRALILNHAFILFHLLAAALKR